MGFIFLRLIAILPITLGLMLPTHADESNTKTEICNNGQYSVLRSSGIECSSSITLDHKPSAARRMPRNVEPLDVEWLEGEILGFTVIGLAQIRGGTPLLGDLWYAAAVLTPPLLKQHAAYGMRLNYLAITPPFVALGLLNGYLHRDQASNARVFLSNFIGFNLSLAWAHHVWRAPEAFFTAAEITHVPQLDTNVGLLRGGGASIEIAYRW